ncbi:tetratricopeptide repeat protein [Sphingobacterium sp. Mn56C]|uniref:tetratricopeptide repeat protein n=1 Tax=Sphingobacterium sp. Mn56C TaxID=3395261 RepID=UPI003BC5DF90
MDKTIQLLEFIKESPHDPFLHYALTMEYVKAEDFEKAKQGFENLVQNFPDYVGTYYHFGKLLEKLNNKSAAEEIYNRGILIASQQRKMHAKGELMGALNMLKGFDDDDDY